MEVAEAAEEVFPEVELEAAEAQEEAEEVFPEADLEAAEEVLLKAELEAAEVPAAEALAVEVSEAALEDHEPLLFRRYLAEDAL